MFAHLYTNIFKDSRLRLQSQFSLELVGETSNFHLFISSKLQLERPPLWLTFCFNTLPLIARKPIDCFTLPLGVGYYTFLGWGAVYAAVPRVIVVL